MIDMQKARAICDHCCAPFSEVTDEHVAMAMEQFYRALDEIDRLRTALIEERARSVELPGDRPDLTHAEHSRLIARQQLEAEGKI